jgi:methylated-DNA-[protein]-cysteine S-methyltransferase
MPNCSVVSFHSALKWIAVAWEENVLQGLVFGYSSARQAESALVRLLRLRPAWRGLGHNPAAGAERKWIGDVSERLVQYADGEPVDFSDVPLALAHLTPFGRRVVEACRGIPWGETRSYGQLAAACGSPGAARAVGGVMAKNRFPLIVPCHRVVGSGGALGGYSAPGGLRTKQRLLAMEAASLAVPTW